MKYLLILILILSSCTKDDNISKSECFNVKEVLHNKKCAAGGKIVNITITNESGKEYITMIRDNGYLHLKWQLVSIECNNLLILESNSNYKRYTQLEYASANGFVLNDIRYYYIY